MRKDPELPAEYKPHSDPFPLLALVELLLGPVFQAFALAKENIYFVMLHTTTPWPGSSQGSTTVFMLYQGIIIRLGFGNINWVSPDPIIPASPYSNSSVDCQDRLS